jgi:hypothetical protein
LEQSFIKLYPYGRGGPGEPRRKGKAVSIEEHAKFVLYKSANCLFGQHSTFGLFVYDLINRKKAFGTLYAKGAVGTEEELVTVTAEELEEQAEFEARRITHRRAGEDLIHPNPNSNAATFLRSLSSMARNTMGSREARLKSQSDAFATSNALGTYHVFLTKNYHDLAMLLDLSSTEELNIARNIRGGGDVLELNIPIKGMRRGLISKNPAMTAFWFNSMVNVLLEEVLGFDPKTKRTRRDGLFGPIKAYHGATEEQVRLVLLMAVLWNV